MLHDIYAKLVHSPPLLSYYHAPPAASSPTLTRLSAVSFPMLPHSLISTVLPDLASFSRSRPSRPPFHIHQHHQHPPIRHPTATYIVARNAESYSVSLDSLKQVLMSCTPTPRSSPTAYPLATEHSSGTLVLPSTSYSLARLLIGFSASLSISTFLFLSFSLSSSLPDSLSVPLFLEPPSSQRTVEFAITTDTLLMPNWS